MPEQGLLEGTAEAQLLEEAGVDLSSVRRIPIGKIQPGQFQPRRHFDQAKLDELAASIKANGQVEPGIVNDLGNGQFALIAGERRWRAVKQLGKATFRAAVIQTSDVKLIARLAHCSNGEREGLNDLEMLESCLEMQQRLQMSETEIATVVGRSVQWVSNTLSLDRLHGKLRGLLGSSKPGGFSRSVGLQLIRVEPADQLKVLKVVRKGALGEKRTRRIVEQLLADGEVSSHASAQDRRTPTEAFLAMVLSNLRGSQEAVRMLTTHSRKKKFRGVDPTEAAKIRLGLREIRELLDEVEQSLSAE